MVNFVIELEKGSVGIMKCFGTYLFVRLLHGLFFFFSVHESGNVSQKAGSTFRICLAQVLRNKIESLLFLKSCTCF